MSTSTSTDDVHACSEPSCGRPARTRGFCRSHYQTKRNRGEIEINKHAARFCTETDCSERHYAKGLCRAHYQTRWRAAEPAPGKQHDVSLWCEVRNCGARTVSRNLCGRHYSRWNTYPELRSLEALALFDEERLCPLCLLKPAAVVDHDHESGKIRGHLCYGCNTALGKVHDDPMILRRMIDYIETARNRMAAT